MKRYYVGILLLLVCTLSCQRDEVSTATLTSLLHRNWHLFQTRKLSSNDWHSWDTDAYYTVEYRADGTMLYRRNGVQSDADCCSPLAYTFRGITIQYKRQQFCANASCITLKNATITQLSETLLELNDGSRIFQYELAN